MNQPCRDRIPRLVFAVLLVSSAGCARLAKVREVQQDLAVDRRGKIVVMPLAATATLCDIQFDEGELEGAKEHFRELIRENLSYAFSKELVVVHPKAVNRFLEEQGFGEDQHYDRLLSIKAARALGAQIVVFGHVKIDPILKESLIEKTKRYDLDCQIYVFDATNDDCLATLRCAGQRKEVVHTIPWLVHKLRFYPAPKPPAKPASPPPQEEKPKAEEKRDL